MDAISTNDRVLNARRRATLNYYEGEIEKAGKALSGVFLRLFNDPEKPWFCEYETLEAYLLERWHMTPRRKQQIMAGESIREQLANVPETSEIAGSLNERQLREIGSVEPEQRAEVLVEARKIKLKLTTGTIKKAKARIVDGVIEDAAKSDRALCPHCGQAMP